MPTPTKKGRPRRVPEERARPAQTKSLFTEAPPGKRLVRTLLTLVFFAITVALVTQGERGIQLEVGDKAPRDFRARESFTVIDLEATRREQNEKASKAVRVFRERPDKLDLVLRELLSFLGSVVKREEVQVLQTEAEERWGLSAEELTVLKNSLTPRRYEALQEKLREVFEEAREKGIWNEETLRYEFGKNRFRIKVIRSANQPEEVSIYDILSLPRKARLTFRARLDEFFKRGDPEEFKKTILDLVMHRLTPTLELDTLLTSEAEKARRNKVAPVYKNVPKGSVLVTQGDVVTEQILRELHKEKEAYDTQNPPSVLARAQRLGSGILAVGVLFLTLGAYIARFREDIMKSNTLFFRVAFLSLALLAVAKVILLTGALAYLIPLSFVAIVLSISCGPAFALGMSTAIALVLWLMMDMKFQVPAVLLLGSAVGIVMLGSPRRRTDLVKVGFWVGLSQAAAIWAFSLMGEETIGGGILESTRNSAVAFGKGLSVGLITTAVMPYVERAFGVVTDMILQEWSDQNQPLLRKLVIEAPGTYHHSIMVGTLAEAAAETIEANPLLTRAASFLHDIGKLNRPDYFIENTGYSAGSKHDRLTPQMSSLIITAHTKDGVELAKRYGVPRRIRDIIEQHHGTTVVEYFHNRALENAPEGEEVEKDSFRYRGPLPQSREGGLLLLADAIEAASRVLANPTPARVRDLVQQIVRRRLLDGQLDQSDLTLTDVRKAQESFVRTLTAILHHRIEYPK